MGRLLAVSAACLVFASPVLGQMDHKNEVFGSAGWGTWWDDEGARVKGLNAGAGVGRRLLPQFAVEAELIAFRGTRLDLGPETYSRSRGILAVGNGVLYLAGSERRRLFVLLGAGLAQSTVETRFGAYYNSRAGTGFVANVGAGAKLFVTRNLALRPEVRLTGGTAGSSVVKPFSAELRLSLGIGYHW